MKAKVYDLSAQVIDEINLPPAIFAVKDSPIIVAKAIRVYLSHQRSAAAKTKNRNEVHGTTKKMWAQKGIGRARHGSAKAPLFVGGGIAHGPSGEQNYSLKINQREKLIARNSVLSKFAKNNSLLIVDGLGKLAPKTKEADLFINRLVAVNPELAKSSKIGLIASVTPTLRQSFGNLSDIQILPDNSLNVYSLATSNFIILTTDSLKNLSKNADKSK